VQYYQQKFIDTAIVPVMPTVCGLLRNTGAVSVQCGVHRIFQRGIERGLENEILSMKLGLKNKGDDFLVLTDTNEKDIKKKTLHQNNNQK